MDVKFDNYGFDATPYMIAANTFSKQFNEKECESNEFSNDAFQQLHLKISEKLSECSNMNEDLKKIRTENLNLQMELDTLKREQEQLSRNSFDLKEGN